MSKAVAFVGVALLLLQVAPYAFASGSAGAGTFSRTLEANGVLLNVTAVYAKNWSWDVSNTVRVTIAKVGGPLGAELEVVRESAALHMNGTDFVLARPHVTQNTPDNQVSLSSPSEFVFTFSNESYTQNARQGETYTSHIAVSVDMDVSSNGALTPVYFANGPGEMVITLNTRGPPAYAPEDSIAYLLASEVVGFGAIILFMKAAKRTDGQKDGLTGV